MRAAVFEGPGNVRVETVPDPEIELASDAVVAVTHAGICGSDLWSYRGYGPRVPGLRTGHEFLGTVTEVGGDVSTVKPGDVVLAPFSWSDGVCQACRRGLQTSCEDGGVWGDSGSDGAHGELVRVPHADGTLVIVPKSLHERPDLVLPLADVVPTGQHAAVTAGVRAGTTVAVVGDGAVGASAALACRRLGAEQVIVIGHHPARLSVAAKFGATDVLDAGPESLEQVMSLTGGVDVALECVGTQSALDTCLEIVRDGGAVGHLGVPHATDKVDLARLFFSNVALVGGMAPVRAYLPGLLADVVAGSLDASALFDLTVDLEGVPTAYRAMDERSAMKVLIEI